ncbi:hypothetical protein GHT06_021142 [Daphnia sinensis]|uniref:Uncharacterized protein n=1 Tax=Daphnia sinensis TaxID=1820382 RepID=A0AAD5PMP2_9CRUS|nr:hypothetical protein GHT06_021142 [Daphnia sinensis]
MEPPTPDDENKVLPEMKIERSLTQNETFAPNCPADKPDSIGPTVQTPTASQFTDLRKAYKEDLKRTNRSLTEAKLALEEAASTRKEHERQCEVHKNQLRLAKEQEERHVQTEKELRTLLNETKKELTRTKRILRRQKARHAKSQDQENVNQDLDNSSNVPPAIENDTATTSSDPVDTTTTEQTPKSKKSRFVKGMHKLLASLGFRRKSRSNKTASVQVTMNGQPVNMVIDKGCFETIISLDQWRKLGEPQLKPLTEHDRITLKRTGKYEQRVTREELGGSFYAIVTLQNKIITLPIYVCTVDKRMPNFLGRRLFHDLQLHKQNAHLIELTHTNETEPSPQTEQPHSVSEMANTTKSPTEQEPATDNTTDSAAEEEPEEENTFVPTYEYSCDLPEGFIACVTASLEDVKERKRSKREKYQTRLSTAMGHGNQIPKKTRNEVKKIISKLEKTYEKDFDGCCAVIRDAADRLSDDQERLADVLMESKRIERAELIQQREKELQAVLKKEIFEHSERLRNIHDAKELLKHAV